MARHWGLFSINQQQIRWGFGLFYFLSILKLYHLQANSLVDHLLCIHSRESWIMCNNLIEKILIETGINSNLAALSHGLNLQKE